jgi:hypothetical protein
VAIVTAHSWLSLYTLGILAEHCMSAVVNTWHKRLSSVHWRVEPKFCAFAFFGAAADCGMWALATVPQGQPPVPAGREVELAPEAVWTLWRREC